MPIPIAQSCGVNEMWMVTLLNLTLKAVSDWRDANRVRYNAAKRQACLISIKLSALLPKFRDVCVPINVHIELLGSNFDLKFVQSLI